ncbi:MAG: toll/interleukin-1 receptor domain-containing protein [Deltaproteobacteria bacterium]|nr:toll/interleukin-1 receptor domain-containing protein [Deltaproteobacteria bacterium]
MDDTYHNTPEYLNSIAKNIAEDASLLSSGTYRDIFGNIDRLEPFQEKVISVLHTEYKDWALRTVLTTLPNTHAASVAFLKSSEKGQKIYGSISSFIKKCFIGMHLTNGNIDIYQSLLAFYYSDKTTIIMLPVKKNEFYLSEFDECKKDYEKIDSLGLRIDKLKVAYRLYEIVSESEVSGIFFDISKHLVSLKIDLLNRDGSINQEIIQSEKENLWQPIARNRVFVSYSWDSNEHKQWVKRLSTKLRSDGVDVTLDQWHTAPGDQLAEFMERSIRENDFVIIICTPKYKDKSDKRTGGVGYEGDIMTAEVKTYKNHRKFIPILKSGNWEESAPSWLHGKCFVRLSGTEETEDNYQDLLDTLLDRKPKAPPIGGKELMGRT